ncbi:unnamed protein product [Clonostachys rosea f. rosea IK726]|uniref:Major facilitator superfamily (MFS) profile domain-containing protein n=2 Tax=Bionectria ochroleuca TaxID=29856 RepID=A0A0B7KPA9_BIOOC|nr:unnamed protein product [Clonostachys rosea f. rosea IK726]
MASPSSSKSPLACRGENEDLLETTPLLDNADAQDSKPLPKGQIYLLCYARLMEMIAFYSVFPYLPQMIQFNDRLPEAEVGFYTGVVESATSIAEVSVLGFWCYLADRIGRKPALVYSIIGMALGPALFGLSRNIMQMVLIRFVSGLFSGAGLIIRTMIGEHSTSKTEAQAYAWFSMSDFIGTFIGPILGGSLADPVRQYPALFSGIEFFEKYPYALPGLVIGGINITGAIMSALFLEETLDRSTARKEIRDQCHAPKPAPQQMTSWQLIKSPGMPAALSIYGQVILIASFYISMLPVALFTPIDLGGIGYTTPQISIYMGAQAASQALWLLVVFPRLQQRMGTRGVLRVCSLGLPLFFSSFILMNVLLRTGGTACTACFWALTFLGTFVGPAVFMSFAGMQLLVNDATPDPSLLGRVNAIALMLCGVIRIAAPSIATVVYAVGVHGQIAGGYLGWVVTIVLSTGLYFNLKWVPDL